MVKSVERLKLHSPPTSQITSICPLHHRLIFIRFLYSDDQVTEIQAGLKFIYLGPPKFSNIFQPTGTWMTPFSAA